jgi:hypothetical protein
MLISWSVRHHHGQVLMMLKLPRSMMMIVHLSFELGALKRRRSFCQGRARQYPNRSTSRLPISGAFHGWQP